MFRLKLRILNNQIQVCSGTYLHGIYIRRFISSARSWLCSTFGALIGSCSSIVVQIIAAIITANNNTKSFRREQRKKEIASITNAYEYALNVIFNIQRGQTPDSTTIGNMFTQISLRGSLEVKACVHGFQALPAQERQLFNIDELIDAIQKHITQLEQSI
jgi:hypothetical protein